MVVGEHERRAGPQHAVHLAQEPVDVLDLSQHAGSQGEVDGVGAQEGEVRDVAFVGYLDR